MNRSRLGFGALCCLTAAVAWGAAFPTAEDVMRHMDPFWMTTFRYGAAAVILCCILYAREGARAFRLEGRAVRLFALGTFGYAVNGFGLFWGQRQLGASGALVTSMAEAMMPFLVVFFVWMTARRRPQRHTLACISLAFVGICLVLTKGDPGSLASGGLSLLPLLSIFAGVTGWVIYTIGSGAFADWSPLRYATITCCFGSLTSVIFSGIGTAAGAVPVVRMANLVPVLGELIFLAAFGGVIASMAWFRGVAILTPSNAILFANFVPITALTIAVFKGYAVSGPEVLGVSLAVLALVANNLAERRPKPVEVWD